jgi:hypothetical protein
VTADEKTIETIAKKLAALKGISWKALDDQARRLWKRDAQHAQLAVEEEMRERAA